MRLFLALFAVIAVLVWMSVFTVDPTEFVYLTQFGRPVATYDGSLTDTDAGLHWRWPWPIQSTRRLDRRLQYFDLPAIELLTHDVAAGGGHAGGSSVDKTLTVEAYACWRIADDKHVDRFVRRIDTFDRARAILGQRINDRLGALIGQMRMDDLISTDLAHVGAKGEEGVEKAAIPVTKVDLTMVQLRDKLLKNLHDQVLEEYGIKIVDIRLKRFNHPINVRETIFKRIISERELKAAYYRNEGKKRAEDIRTVADASVQLLSKAAEKVEKETKLEAEAEAELIRVAAFNQDKIFFSFWQKMEQMKSILGNPKTTLLLSTHRGVFDFLFNAPADPGSQPSVLRTAPPDGNVNGLPAAKKED